jgi:hypothetical protein
MEHIFYIIVCVLAFVELVKMPLSNKLYLRMKELRTLDKKSSILYMNAHPSLYVVFLHGIIAWIIVIVGLMSTQWFCFLFIILLSSSRFGRLGPWATYMDSFMSAAVYLFAVVNKYHLHLNIMDLILK